MHRRGQQAKTVLDEARASVAQLLGAKTGEVVFTSGGSEANNLAIRGIGEVLSSSGRRHLVASAIEHEAVLETLKSMSKQGWTTTLVPVDSTGVVSPASLSESIRKETALVSVMHANNEIGTIQPIAELAGIAHESGALFHTDAVQSVGKLPISVRTLNVDLLSLSGHKLNGPKGVGALWVKRDTRLISQMTGGGQERNRRAGTENVPAISGLGTAARLALEKIGAETNDVANLRDQLEMGILNNVFGTRVNGDQTRRLPNTCNISFDGVEGESLLIALDLEGVAVSTGSACSSGRIEPSHVLRAMGFSHHRSQNSIRFSLGLGNTIDEVNRVISLLPGIVDRLRKLTGRRVHHEEALGN